MAVQAHMCCQAEAMLWHMLRHVEVAWCCHLQARQQVQEMVWMKQSEDMVLEAMTRLSTVHDALEELLMGSVMSRPQTADSNAVK